MFTENKPVVRDYNGITRAFRETKLASNPNELEDLAIELDMRAKGHTRSIRGHLYALGPVLYLVREQQLYSHHPEGFTSFEEWLDQPDIRISPAKASDIINWWLHALPELEKAGYTFEEIVETIDESKLRTLVAPLRRAHERGQNWSTDEIRDWFEVAKISSARDLERYVKAKANPGVPEMEGVSEGSFEPELDPLIQFQVIRRNDRYEIRGYFDEEEMRFIERKLRPTWVDLSGKILRVER